MAAVFVCVMTKYKKNVKKWHILAYMDFFRTSAAKIIVDNGRQICHTLVRERQDKCD